MTKTPRVLLVDDEASILRLCSRLLVGMGLSVETAATAAAAASALEGRSFELLVCDLHLPDGSGLAVADLFRALQPGAAVVLITGVPPDGRRTAHPSFDVMVGKPFDVEQFQRAVREALGRAP